MAQGFLDAVWLKAVSKKRVYAPASTFSASPISRVGAKVLHQLIRVKHIRADLTAPAYVFFALVEFASLFALKP